MVYNTKNPRQQDQDDDCNKCKDTGTPTEKSIEVERKKVCSDLAIKFGEARQWEQARYGARQLYDDKQCAFVKTETNYRYYRNLELAMGVELVQVNDDIKDNVKNYKKWNDDLAAALKDITKTAKEAKVKFKDLKEAGDKLETCLDEICNSSQKKLLTGKSTGDCLDGADKEPKCENAEEILDKLVNLPKEILHEMDLIYHSATRVTGIQVFSNVSSLEPLQKNLQDKSKAFDDLIQEKMKKGAEDLKKAQEDLTKAVQELTKATSGLYFRRSLYKGTKEATEELCCPECKCIKDGGLEKCKCDICKICDDVKAGVCVEKGEDDPCGCD